MFGGRNTVSIIYIQSSDNGKWSVRPRSREGADAGVWCNFTVSIRQDDDYDVDDDLQNDQQHSNDQLADDMIEYGDYDTEDDVEEVNAASGPRPANFTRLKKMKLMQSMVKPAGATITYKCPADGEHFALFHDWITSVLTVLAPFR